MEREFVEWLRQRLPATSRARLGLNDDAAALSSSFGEAQGELVVTVDTVTDGVDFRVGEAAPEQIGHKALAVNLSDLAAMAAEPVAAVVSIVVPQEGAGALDAVALAKGVYEGILPLAERFDAAVVGGDTTTWDGGLAITITAMGRTTAAGPLTRSGAKVGDWVLVTGSFGGSILGKHLAFEPRVSEALALHKNYKLTAGMDVSDGLALDASRLAKASGVGIALRLADVPIAEEACRYAETTGKRPLDHALGDGEDFELLVTAPPDVAERILDAQPLEVPITCIGRCVADAGLWELGEGDALRPLAATGFEY